MSMNEENATTQTGDMRTSGGRQQQAQSIASLSEGHCMELIVALRWFRIVPHCCKCHRL